MTMACEVAVAEVAAASRPWGFSSRLVVGVGSVLGLAAVAAGWWGASGEPTVGGQFRWVGLGVTGLVLAGAAGALWVLTGLRAVGLRSRVTVPLPEQALVATVELRAVPEMNGTEMNGNRGAEPLVASAGMRYFHRASCALAQGKPVRSAERAEHVREGRVPCGICQPIPGPEVCSP